MSVSREPSVAIIGAGLGGVAAGVHLARAGISHFTIFEQSAGPGGTWWDNTYPGAECDIEIAFYSYSFAPHDWPRSHASQAEIQAYIQKVIDTNGLTSHMRYGTRVDAAVWNDREHFYTVTTATGETLRFDIVVSALGLLNVPRYPEWPGLERFTGPKFHTARWEHQHDLTGKRVAVVGTGSTAAQVVPAIAPVAGTVTMFAREPSYVVPKNEHHLSAGEIRKRDSPLGRRIERAKIFWRIERGMAVRNPQSKAQQAARASFTAYKDRVFAGRPDLHELMTPKYPFACKRPLLSTDLFPALTRENVRVVPHGVTHVSERGVVDDTGTEHEADVIVMATGFQPWAFLKTLKLVGRDGRSIHEVWGDTPRAYAGIHVAGFPNFFMMYGPNTNHFCVTFMLEQQAEHIARVVKRMKRTGKTAVDVRTSVMDLYNGFVQRSLAKKTLEGNCHNYYHAASGKNVVTWPWWGSVYVLLTRLSRFALTARRAP